MSAARRVFAAKIIPIIPPGSKRPARLVIVPANAALNAAENSCTEVRDSLARRASSSFAHCNIRLSKCGHAMPALIPIANNERQMIKICPDVEISVGMSHNRTLMPKKLNIGEYIMSLRTFLWIRQHLIENHMSNPDS